MILNFSRSFFRDCKKNNCTGYLLAATLIKNNCYNNNPINSTFYPDVLRIIINIIYHTICYTNINTYLNIRVIIFFYK